MLFTNRFQTGQAQPVRHRHPSRLPTLQPYPVSMNNSVTHSGTWLQRLWWSIRNLYQELKPCRFSFIVALLACPVFLMVAQGTEVLRTVGEGSALGGQSEPFRLFLFFAALFV